MSSKKLRNIENLIMLTFPLVLFAGCAGSDVKPVQQEPAQMTITENEITDQSYSYEAPDAPRVTSLKPELIIEKITPEEEFTKEPIETQLAEMNENVQETILITTPEKKIFFFATNVHFLSEAQRSELKEHADYLLSNPDVKLVINGHADERGTENYNQSLSEKRANETYKYLVDLGVSETQLIARGFGELIPMNVENNWDENRRVELQYTDPVMLSAK